MTRGALRWPLFLALGGLGACESPDSAVAEIAQAVPDEPEVVTLRLCGSTTLGDTVLPAVWAQFATGRAVDASFTTMGSQQGLEALTSGSCDLAMFSGTWSPELASKHPTVQQHAVGKDALLVMTGPDSPGLTEVSLATLAQWYQGQGRPKGLQVFGQPASHGTHDAFSQLLQLPTQTVDATYDDVASITGAGSWLWYESAQRLVDRKGFSPVAVRDGKRSSVEPSLDTMISGQYPLMRDLHLLVGPGDTAQATLARAFVTFATGSEAAPLFEAQSMLHLTSQPKAAPVSGRCDPPALIAGDRVGFVPFEAQQSEPQLRAVSRALRTGVRRSIDTDQNLVVVAYTSSAESEPCALAAERGKQIDAKLSKLIDELAKTVRYGARLPDTRVVVAGPTKHWGVRPGDNQQVLVMLTPQ